MVPRWLSSAGVKRAPLKVVGFVTFSCLCVYVFSDVKRGVNDLDVNSLLNQDQNEILHQKLRKDAQSKDDSTNRSDLRFSENNKYENDRLIMYNRVPKCASTGIRLIMRSLKKYNHFHLDISQIFNKEWLNHTAQGDLASSLTKQSQKTPTVFVRHVRFIDFNSHEQKAPIYINVVREPFQRLVSDYYFKRFHLGYMYPRNHTEKHRSYDECVEKNLRECVADGPSGYFRIIPYFCGMDPKCMVPSQWALDRAKETVVKHYTVVGVAEDVPGFMSALDKLLPQYFTGARTSFDHNKDHLKEKLKTRGKIPPKNSTIEIMKKKLSYDYEFYYFVLQRFNQLKTTLGISG